MNALFNQYCRLGISIFSLFLVHVQSAYATDVSGTIFVDTTWTLAGSPYNIVDAVYVDGAATLTIEPGVQVIADQFESLNVRGALIAIGTSGSPIVFDGSTSTPGWWTGIDIFAGGSATLEYCQVKATGYWNAAGIYITDGTELSVKNSLLKDSSGAGIRINTTTAAFTSENNSFEDNLYGIQLSSSTSFSDTTSTFTNNTTAPVAVDGMTHMGDVSWELASLNSIVLLNSQTISAGGTLTIKPGTVVKSLQYKAITVDGQLNAIGTSGSRIYFTSHRDDTVGGDSNIDGGATTPVAGWWTGLHIRNAGSATLDYCAVSYAGYWNAAGVYKTDTGNLTLSNSTFANTAGAGLRLSEGYGSFSSTSNQYNDNTYGVRLSANTSFSDTTSTFSNNVTAPVAIDGSTHTTDVSWELSSAYSMVIIDSQTISEGATLTLQPGLVLKSFQYDSIVVDGQLNAIGTEEAPIHMTSHLDDSVGGDSNNNGNANVPVIGWWTGIHVQNTGSATLAHCTVSYGGYWNAACIYKTQTGSLSISNSTLQHANGAGLRLTEGSASFSSMNNRFNDNTYGVRLSKNTSFSDTTSTFSNNSTAPVAIDGSAHTEDVSWELSSEYAMVVLDGQTVETGATLTLQPGLVLKFEQYEGMTIDGALVADGTADMPIHFTSDTDDSVGGDSNNDGESSGTPGWWASVHIRNEGDALFNHCTFSFNGYWDATAIYKLGTGDLSLRNTLIQRSSGAGLRLAEGSGMFLSEFNRFHENVDGVRLGLNTSFRDHTSTFSQNTTSQVSADGGSHTGEFMWELSSHYSILIPSNHTIEAGATLTVKPGTTVKFTQYRSMIVNGELVAEGTAGAPITFTDYRDDSIGGDSNNDAGGTIPAGKWWGGILIEDGATGTFNHANIIYGGYLYGVGVRKQGNSSLTFTNSSISEITTAGAGALFLFNTTGPLEISRSQFINSIIGINVKDVAEQVVIQASNFEGNVSHGVANNNSAEVDARGNWWGDASGPFHPTLNSEGLGNAVTDNVLFDPWRTTASTIEILAPARSGTIVAGDTLSFKGSLVDDPLVGYLWDFDDGRTSPVRVPGLVTFPNSGSQSISLSGVTDGVVDPVPDIRDIVIVPNDGSHPDLKVESFVVPPSIGIGQPVMIDYTVKNVGLAATPGGGSWTDRIYLSSDDTFDASDLQLSAKEIERVLGPQEIYEESLPVTLPPVEEGARYLILSINDIWDIIEIHRLNNEQASPIDVLVPKLTLGETLNGSYEKGSTQQFFTMQGEGGKNLLLEFSGDDPGLEVFVRFGELPTRADFDYRFTGGSIVIPAAADGTWYVMVYGDNLEQAGNFNLKYSQVDVAVTSVSPSVVDGASPIFLSMTGAGFAPPLSLELVASNDSVFVPDDLSIDSFTGLSANFGAGTLPADTYDVRVNRDGTEFTLANGVAVISGGSPDFQVDITSPTPMGYHQLATIWVEYSNEGNAPMAAPMLVVTALQNERPGALLTLDRTQLFRGFWTSAIPKGYSTSVRMMAGGDQPGLLLPGESMRVPVYYAGWLRPWDFRYPPFEFKVVALTAEDPRPIEWNQLKPTLRPPDTPEAAWDGIWSNLTTAVGSTVGDFVTMLSRNAVYLSKLGVDVNDVNELLTFELLKARGLIGPLSELTAATDLDPHLGLVDLKLFRKFPRNLTQRHRLGPLGYGWNHIWEITLTEEADGTVVINHGNGASRVYQPDSRGGVYFASRGDTAALRKSGGTYTLTEQSGNQLAFDGSGLLTHRSDRHGNSVQLQYDGNRLSRLTHSNGIFIDLGYNGAGFLDMAEDSLGRKVTFEYDANSHLIKVTDSKDRVTRYAYDVSASSQLRHSLTRITYPGDIIHNYTYDSFGRLASHNTGFGTTVFDYAQGDLVSTDGEGNKATASFDHFGSLRKIMTPQGGVVTYGYDEALNNTQLRGEDGSAMEFAYDRDKRITEAVNQNGDAKSYTSSEFAQYGSSTSAEGRRIIYEYDANDNLSRMVYPNGNSESFVYDSSGRRTQHVSATGVTETTTYNAVGLPLTKSYSDGTTRAFTYDSNNRLVTATNEEGTTTLDYDANENLVKVTYPNDLYIEYEYDSNSRLIETRDHKGMTNRYAYDGAGFLERLTDGDDELLVRYEYDAVGRLQTRHFSTGARTEYERNPDGHVIRQTTYDRLDAVIAGYEVQYDNTGQVREYQALDGLYSYEYDQAGNVLEEVFEPSSGPTVTKVFEYNADNELIKETTNGVEMVLVPDALGRYTSVGTSTALFDDAGNLIQKNNGSGQLDYSYHATGKLATMETDAGDYSISYDALGIPFRVVSPDTTINYLYDINGLTRVFGEYKANGDPLRTYQNGLALSVIHYGGESYFPEFDPLAGNTDFVLPTTVESGKALGPLPESEPRLIADAIYQYADDHLMTPENYGRVMDGFVALHRTAQRIGKEIDLARKYPHRAGAQALLDFVRNPTVGAVSGYIGLLGPLSDFNQWVGNLSNIRVVITDPPQPLVDSIDFLMSEGVGEVLNVLGVIAGSVEAADGVQATWDRGRDVDWLDVVNPFGTPDGDTNKIRHGLASAAGPIIGMVIAGAAAAPWIATAATIAGVAGWISDNTGGLQEEFWIWWDDLDVTGERLAGSSVSGSTDPNQKLGIAGYGPQNYVAGDTLLSYRIDFENDPSATAPAQVVIIKDKLPDEVDASTFEILDFGFGDINIPVDPGTSFVEEVIDYEYEDDEYEFEVEVHVEIRIENREIFAIFYSIDPESGLPPPVNIGFLPPEVDNDSDDYMPGQGRGQGHLSYSVSPMPDLPTDTEIRNIATIQFDFSFDIDTNQVDPLDASKGTDPEKEALVTIDSDIPAATVDVLPALSLSNFNVSWDGQSASGMESFDVYVRANGGVWMPWLTGTDRTSAEFGGIPDGSYEFYAVGRNNVGVGAPYLPEAQASTLAGIDDLFVVAEQGTDDKLELSWIAVSGCEYQIQSSADLQTWTDVGTRQSTDESLEIISFKDETYDFQADRFYRIVIFKP